MRTPSKRSPGPGRTLSRLSTAFAGILALLTIAGAAHAVDPVNSSFFGGVAIKGYDPVAYFAEGHPAEGSDDYEVEWRDATWRFANAENRDAFEADPEKYAPQYGGYCAYAVSQGYTAKGEPKVWKIVNGKLYLNFSKGVQKTWQRDIPGHIKSANANWPSVLN